MSRRTAFIADRVREIIAGLHAEGLLPCHSTGYREGATFIPLDVTPVTAGKIAAALCSRAPRPTEWKQPEKASL